MPRRVTPSQFKNMVRQAQQAQKRAIDDYNRQVRQINAQNQRAVDDYNRQVRARNAKVRAHRQRLQQEIDRLNRLASQPHTTTRYVTTQRSVLTLRQSFTRLEEAAASGSWTGNDTLLDLAERETANSVAALNAMLAEPSDATDADGRLRQTSLTTELIDINPDLDQRWRGALFALHPGNPDAARHFCTSSRELLGKLLESEAPDHAVKQHIPNYPKTPHGDVSRRARIFYLLHRGGRYSEELDDFASSNIDDVISLFDDFNSGTHGDAGRFDFPKLLAIKERVEGAVQFLYSLAKGPQLIAG